MNLLISENSQPQERMEVFDSHCHYHLDSDGFDFFKQPAPSAESPQISKSSLCLMGTAEGDWDNLTKLAASLRDDDKTGIWSHVHEGFGVHPWHAHRVSDKWLEQLEALLIANPRAVVGEIGLDKVSKTPETGKCEKEAQERVFMAQWDLACRLGRPVSVHCVKAHGFLSELCRKSNPAPRTKQTAPLAPHPPVVGLHSYSGSADIAAQLVGLRATGTRYYFGFAHAINARTPQLWDRLKGCLKVIPRDRVLLESDLENPEMKDEHLVTMLELLAKEWDVSVEEAARQTQENAERFFSSF